MNNQQLEELREKYKNIIKCFRQEVVCKMTPELNINYSISNEQNLYEDLSIDTDNDIILRAVSTIYNRLGIFGYIYHNQTIYYYNNAWYKYTSNANPINHNLSTALTNLQLFKLIKRILNNFEKKQLERFVSRPIDLIEDFQDENKTNEYILKNIKNFSRALNTYSKMTIDSSEYLSIKALLEDVLLISND